MNPNTESKIRNAWVDRLWKRKGYDSPDEFKEHSYCFACGMTGALKARSVAGESVSGVNDVHLLCNHCHTASRGLKGLAYWRWFLKRTATNTIAVNL